MEDLSSAILLEFYTATCFSPTLRFTVRIFSILLICAVIGVVINYFREFPWEGLEYSLGGVEIEAVRSWMDMFAIKRLSGFARTSYDAAIQILLLALFLFCYLKNNLSKYLLWLLVAPPLLLTTSKGIIITYFLLTLLFLIFRSIVMYYKLYRMALYLLLAVTIILPITSIILPMYHNVPLVLKSLLMRAESMGWPRLLR